MRIAATGWLFAQQFAPPGERAIKLDGAAVTRRWTSGSTLTAGELCSPQPASIKVRQRTSGRRAADLRRSFPSRKIATDDTRVRIALCGTPEYSAGTTYLYFQSDRAQMRGQEFEWRYPTEHCERRGLTESTPDYAVAAVGIRSLPLDHFKRW